MTEPEPRAVFVSAAIYLNSSGPAGGVQLCTREYLATLRAAGYEAHTLSYEADRRLRTRLRRFLGRRPYADLLPPGLADRVVTAAEGASAVFLNQVDLTPLAAELRSRLPQACQLVLLSHGLESVDLLHALRAREPGRAFAQVTRREGRILGECLMTEARYREHIDQVICLASFEVEVERWLGSRRVIWLPRTVPSDPLPWSPTPGWIGFVGTLSHPPNREGLDLLLAALARRGTLSGVRVRIVGGPASMAASLVRRYPFVDYLGSLSDEQLRHDASGWAAFVHPLFCYARGCSTKLAVGLGWEIPVFTTPAGCRGYEWRDGEVPTAESPDGLAALCERASDLAFCRAVRERVRAAARSAPTLADVGDRLLAALRAVRDPPPSRWEVRSGSAAPE